MHETWPWWPWPWWWPLSKTVMMTKTMMMTRTFVLTKPTEVLKLNLMQISWSPCAKPVLVQDLSHVALFPLAAEGSLSNSHSRVSFSFPNMIIIPGCSCTGTQDQAHHSYECQLHIRLCPAYHELKHKHHSKTGINSTRNKNQLQWHFFVSAIILTSHSPES